MTLWAPIGWVTFVAATLLYVPAGIYLVGGIPVAEAHLAQTLAEIDDWRIALTTKEADAALVKELEAAEATSPRADLLL